MVIDKLIEVLSGLGHPVMKQGSLLPDEPYPDHLFTYWNNSSDGNSFYSNDERSILWNFSVILYSVDDPVEKLSEAKRLLRQAGFIVGGFGYDVASDEPTHTGRGMTVLYREEL